MLNDINKPYKLYLAVYSFGNAKRILCKDLEEVEEEMNNARDYKMYLLVYHDFEQGKDDILAQGYFEEKVKTYRLE